MPYSSDQHGDVIDAVQPVFASWGARFGASLIDFVVLIPISAAAYYFTIFEPSVVAMMIISIATLLYGPLMDTYNGGTFGKQALKQRVVQKGGTPITLTQGFMRSAPWLIMGLVNMVVTYQILSIPGLADANGWMEASLLIAENTKVKGFSITQLLQQLSWILPVASSLFILGNREKQAAHDILAETFVIKVDPIGGSF